jgi:hypothetical protein
MIIVHAYWTDADSNKTKSHPFPNGLIFILTIASCPLLLKATYTLISTSIPLGNSSFIKASTVFEFEL